MRILKNMLLTCLIAMPSAGAFAYDLHLDVTNIEVQKGDVLIVLYDSEEAYSNSAAPLSARKLPANASTLNTVFKGLSAGDYAIKLFHDANGNGQLDKNMVGIPIEGYGFSNDAGKFGPASYEDARFSLGEDTQLVIALR